MCLPPTNSAFDKPLKPERGIARPVPELDPPPDCEAITGSFFTVRGSGSAMLPLRTRRGVASHGAGVFDVVGASGSSCSRKSR